MIVIICCLGILFVDNHNGALFASRTFDVHKILCLKRYV